MGVQRPPSAPAPAVGSGSTSPRPNGASAIYYFYVLDPEFGPGFIKICTYFPYPAKVWLNGHEWAKRQADHAGIGYTALANGFATCDHPDGLQAICDRFGPADVQGFFDRWIDVIPTPFTADGPGRRLLVGTVDAPSRGVTHAGVRRPPPGPRLLRSVRHRQHRRRPPRRGRRRVRPRPASVAPPRQPFPTRVFTPGTEVKMDFRYKHSRVKQYLKEGRALRIETVINKPSDIGVLARLEHLPELVAKARARQRSSAICGTCRSGLCHRLCALRAHPPALHTERANEPEPCASGTHAPWP